MKVAEWRAVFSFLQKKEKDLDRRGEEKLPANLKKPPLSNGPDTTSFISALAPAQRAKSIPRRWATRLGLRSAWPRKVMLAKNTTVSQAWIVGHLGVKNAAKVSRVIHRMHLSQFQEEFSGNLKRFVSQKMKENAHSPLAQSCIQLHRNHGRLPAPWPPHQGSK